jgi:hypothetical protein
MKFDKDVGGGQREDTFDKDKIIKSAPIEE